MDYKPIETRYARCRFRSRLEARWAVFFDTMHIRWQYEPEGFERDVADETIRYLPDFWLPDIGIYAEVKGSDAQLKKDAKRIAWMVDFDGPCAEGVVILGPIPRCQSYTPAFSTVYHVESALIGTFGAFVAGMRGIEFICGEALEDHARPLVSRVPFEDCSTAPDLPANVSTEIRYKAVVDMQTELPTSIALTRACSARFEYGERMATQ